MPKRFLVILGALALGLAACNNSSATPNTTPIPSESPTVDPSITTTSVYVTVAGTAQPHVPVQISTPQSSSSPRPGTPFATVSTRPLVLPSAGYAHFKDLRPGRTYCWVATIPFRTPAPTPSPSTSPSADANAQSPTPTPSPLVATTCTNNWQFQDIPLGT